MTEPVAAAGPQWKGHAIRFDGLGIRNSNETLAKADD